MSARITDLGIAAIRVMDEPNLTNLGEYSDLIRAEYDAELTALRQQVADLRAALEEQDEACRARIRAATQPQEVQP